MTKKSSVLHSKLQELSSILDDLLLHAPDQTQSHESLSKDIKNKIAFIRKLLSAEVASNSQSPLSSSPHHLHHISERLASLEKAFHAWNTHQTLSPEDINIDNDSTCSCSNDEDGEEEEEEVFHDDVGDTDKDMVEFHDERETTKVGFDRIASFANYEDAKEFFEGSSRLRVERKELGSKEETRRGGNSACYAKACGFMLGMFLMGFIILIFCGCFDPSVEQHSFAALPT
ncbi:hypothetical protein HN51_010834 [Arachis hypogaea]|nr:uncharacterized protein DS421_3g69880 [Arachis hypogaea]